jgi:hypothetical protein
MKVLEDDVWRRFENEMVTHSKVFSPRLCKFVGDDQVSVVVRSAIGRAAQYAFTCRGPIRLYLEMTLFFGAAFDNDPQYRAFAAALGSSGDEMTRAERLYQEFLDYLKVPGFDDTLAGGELKELLAFDPIPAATPGDNFVFGLRNEMARIVPGKAAYAGEEGLEALIQEGIVEAQRYGFDAPRQQALIVGLMFALGHGATDDPLYPWISNTLRDEGVGDPAAKAGRLEREALKWVNYAMAADESGAEM